MFISGVAGTGKMKTIRALVYEIWHDNKESLSDRTCSIQCWWSDHPLTAATSHRGRGWLLGTGKRCDESD